MADQQKGPDWADELALQIARDYDAFVSVEAHHLVAGRLRLLRAQAERDGMMQMLRAGEDEIKLHDDATPQPIADGVRA